MTEDKTEAWRYKIGQDSAKLDKSSGARFSPTQLTRHSLSFQRGYMHEMNYHINFSNNDIGTLTDALKLVKIYYYDLKEING